MASYLREALQRLYKNCFSTEARREEQSVGKEGSEQQQGQSEGTAAELDSRLAAVE